MMKLKKKTYVCGSIVIIIISVLLMIFLAGSKSYELSYKIDGFNIKEKYDKEKKLYIFSTKHDNQELSITLLSNKLKSKKLIEDIKSIKNDNEYCIYLRSEKINTYPICYNGSEIVTFNVTSLSSDKDFYDIDAGTSKDIKYKNINIKNLYDKNVLIWNNKGYYFINNKEQKEIALFNSEKYYDTKSYKIKNYVIIPNYDEEYTFNKFYIIDLKTGKNKDWKLESKINHNFYYLGVHHDNIYLVDKKDQLEYSLNPKKKKIEIITDKNNNGLVWSNKWNEISMTKLVNDEYKFKHKYIYNYYLNKTYLYLSIDGIENPIKLSNKKIDKIIQMDNDSVYYLCGDELYFFNFQYGEQLLIQYNEWNFNKDNPIYIY